MRVSVGAHSIADKWKRGRSAIAIATVGVLGQVALALVYSGLGQPPYGLEFLDNHGDARQALMISMTIVAFATTAALALWFATRLWPSVARWHAGRLSLLVLASCAIGYTCWRLLDTSGELRYPAEHIAAGVVFALFVAMIVVPFSFAWRWFGDRQ